MPTQAAHVEPVLAKVNLAARVWPAVQRPPTLGDVIALVPRHGNDLEARTISLHPAIAQALTALRALPGCRLTRMPGSGASCFGLFDSIGRHSGSTRVALHASAMMD